MEIPRIVKKKELYVGCNLGVVELAAKKCPPCRNTLKVDDPLQEYLKLISKRVTSYNTSEK